MRENNSIIKKYRVIAENFLSLSILNALSVLLPLLTIPFLTRNLGHSAYGVYSYIYALIQFVILIVTYGFNFSATKLISCCREDKAKVNTIFNAVMASKTIIALFVIAVVLILRPLLLKTEVERVMFYVGSFMVLGDILTPTWLFQGLERMKYVTIVNASSKLLFTMLVFIVIRGPEHLVLLMGLNSLGYILAGILSIILVSCQFRLRYYIPSFSDIRFQLRDSLSIFGSTFGMNMYRRCNVLLLKWIVGDDSIVGIYNAAEQIIMGCQSVINPLTQALFPHLSLKFENGTHIENVARLKKIAIPFSAVVIFIATLLAIVASPQLLSLLGDKFSEASLLIRCMTPVIAFGCLNYLIGIAGLVNMNRQDWFLTSVIITGIFSVVYMLFTAYSLQAIAAATAMSLSEALLFVLCVVGLLKKEKK